MANDDFHPCSSAGRSGATAAIRFRIGGRLRFLSHAQTLRVFERACVRAGTPVRYSEGFNPHPKLSLPLPRPVGVESEDELLVARLTDGRGGRPLERGGDGEALKQGLAEQLPAGIEISTVTLTVSNASFHPQSAEYVLPLRATGDAAFVNGLRDRIAGVMGGRACLVTRSAPAGKAARQIDVRPFLRSMRLENGNLVVQHLTGAAGSVRVEEIMQLLGLHVEDLAGPPRRTNVIWGTEQLHDTAE